VTFEEKGGKTLVVVNESHPSKEALDAAGTGAAEAMRETFDQLDELLVALGESSGRSPLGLGEPLPLREAADDAQSAAAPDDRS